MDSDTLITCRFVCKDWHGMLANTKFWMTKCQQKHMGKKIQEMWMRVMEKTKLLNDPKMDQKVIVCLMKLHHDLEHFYWHYFNYGTRKRLRKFEVSQTQLRPLMIASKVGEADLVKFILSHKLNSHDNANNRDNLGYTPILYAVQNDHLKAVEALIPFTKLNTCGTSKCNFSPLHFAAFNGNLELVKILRERDNLPRWRDNFNAPPIYYAAEKGHTKTIKLLAPFMEDKNKFRRKVRRSKDPSSKDDWCQMSLMHAVDHEKHRVVETLVMFKEHLDFKDLGILCQSVKMGRSPRHAMTLTDRVFCQSLLISFRFLCNMLGITSS